jgi:hypothetical protein
MAVKLGEALVYIRGENQDLKKGFKDGEAATKSFVGKVGDLVHTGIGGAFQRVAEIAGGILTARMLEGAVRAVSNFAKSFISEAMAAQVVGAQLDAVLKSTGGAAGMTRKELDDLATSLSEITPVEDDAVSAGMAMMLTFTNIGKKVFPDATKALLDMATAMNSGAAPSAEQLKTQAMQLGKALNDPVAGLGALRRVGVAFTESQVAMVKQLVAAGKVEEAQKLILAELQKEFGGSAEAAGKTLTGSLKILKNAFGNLKEVLGGAVIPLLTKLAQYALPYVQKATTWLGEQVAKLPQAFKDLQFWASSSIAHLAQTLPGPLRDIGLMLAGVVNGSVSIGDAWKYISGKIGGWLAPVKAAFDTTLAWIGGAIAKFKDAYKAGGLLGIAQLVIDEVVNFVPTAKAWLVAAGAQLWQWLNDGLAALGEKWPIFADLKAWLDTNLPLAIQTAADAWNNEFLPALKTSMDYIVATAIPTIKRLSVEGFAELQTQINGVKLSLDSLTQPWADLLLAVQHLKDALGIGGEKGGGLNGGFWDFRQLLGGLAQEASPLYQFKKFIDTLREGIEATSKALETLAGWIRTLRGMPALPQINPQGGVGSQPYGPATGPVGLTASGANITFAPGSIVVSGASRFEVAQGLELGIRRALRARGAWA